MNFKKLSLFISILFLIFIVGCTNDNVPLKEYAVKFSGHNNQTIDIILVKENEKITYPEVPTVEGYTFIGWDPQLEYATTDITIKAIYEKVETEKYTVKFLGFDNIVLKEETVEKGKNATAPTAPDVDGYTFKGWDKSFDNVTTNLEVKAIYEKVEAEKYTVKFLGFDNTVLKEETVEKGKNATAPTAPDVDGYTFKGWDQAFDNVTSNLEVKAIYEKVEAEKYTVKFLGFDNTVLKEETVEKGKNATAPTIPSIEGYVFTGWNQNFTNITSNLEVKANYTIIVYTVTFYDINNNIINTQKVEYNKNAIPPSAPIIDGYSFIGWNMDFNNVKSDLNIRPRYDVSVFIVKFFDDKNILISEQYIEFGKNATEPEKPLKVGYTFVSWDQAFDNVTSNLEIKPIFDINKYLVNFYDANDNIISSQMINHGSAATAPNYPSKDGYTFKGWDKEFNSVTSDLNIKPIFEKNAEVTKYIVKFYDANNNVISTQEVTYGNAAVEPSAPTKNGYTFKGWDKEFNSVTSDLNIRPIFEKNAEVTKYIVKFYDANNNVISTQEVTYGNAAVEPSAPTKNGYTFKGWDKEFDYITTNLNIYPVFTLNTEVEDNTTYTVTFLDKNGNTLSTQNIKKGSSAVAPTAPSIDFYRFVGWDKSFDNVTNNLTIKPIYEKTHTTYAISNVNYWLQILTDKYDLQKELLTQSEIKAYNNTILSDYNKTKVVDVTSISSSTTGTKVKELINRYTNISKYTVYNASTNIALTSTDRSNILNNRNLDAISTNVTVKYGLIVDFAWVRSYPTNHYSNDYYMDRFQETSLNVGEGVAIYHTSKDGNWYFVQAQNYNGWVEKKFIAECSYTEMKNFLNPTTRLVVISNYETIEGAHVRMGQSFPLISQGTNYQISFPTRTTTGSLYLKTVTLSNKNSYSVGYLPYTYENIFKQAFKLLGINYSWGDKEQNGRDCSSTMNGIYQCFGFMMPRNTSNQVSIPTYGKSISGITSTVMKTYNPGTLIFTSSHVMMYIGENENGVSYLLHNTTSGNGECILQSLDSYGGSKMIGVLRLQ